MGGQNIERALKQKEEMLKTALSRADSAKAALMDLEDTKQALYGKISSDIDQQVKEFKSGLKASLDQMYQELKADAADAIDDRQGDKDRARRDRERSRPRRCG